MFINDWLTDEDLIALIVNEKAIIKLLTDIQTEWRSIRAINKDPEDRLLIGSECIDEIIWRVQTLETVRDKIKEQIKAQEEKEEE